jgi:hypothetical protein
VTHPERCATPIGLARLLDYWLDELPAEATEPIDEHLLGCACCSAELGALVALGGAVRESLRCGTVRAFLTDPFIRHLIEGGRRVREYRVPHNGSVNCAVAPGDDVLSAYLEVPLAGVSRVDAFAADSLGPTEHAFRDIPFDAARGEVVLMPNLAALRGMPSHRFQVRLVAVAAAGERVIGEYTFVHTAGTPTA